MPDDTYSVKINRRDGVVEITGPDKEWIAEQLDRLSNVYDSPPTDVPTPDPPLVNPSDRRVQSKRTRTNAANADESKEKRPRGRRAAAARARKNPELEQKLTKAVRAELQRWRDERQANFTNLSKQAAIIATFLLDNLSWEDVDPDDLYTVYAVMGSPPPGSPRPSWTTLGTVTATSGRGKTARSS